MEAPTHYKNGLPQLPYQEAEAAQALAGSELLQEVDMIAPLYPGYQASKLAGGASSRAGWLRVYSINPGPY
jgi:hypothetical protein